MKKGDNQRKFIKINNYLKFLYPQDQFPQRHENLFAKFLHPKKQNTKLKEDLGKESDGAEECEPQMGASRSGFNGGLVLDYPERKVYGDPLVPEEIKALSSSVRFQ